MSEAEIGSTADTDIFALMDEPTSPSFLTQYPDSSRAQDYGTAYADYRQAVRSFQEGVRWADATGYLGTGRQAAEVLREKRARLDDLASPNRLDKFFMFVTNLLP